MQRRTRPRDEQDNTNPPPPSNNNQEEEEKDADQQSSQRQRTEPPPPPPEVPTPPSGGGGLAGAFSRAGVPDASRPPGPQDQQNESFSRGVASATFKPKYCDKLTPESVEALTQNRAYALQSGADK